MGINFNSNWTAKLRGNANTTTNKTVTASTSQTEATAQAQNGIAYMPGKQLTTNQWKNLVLNNGIKVIRPGGQIDGLKAETMSKDWGEIECYPRSNRPDVGSILDQGAQAGDTFKCNGKTYVILDCSSKGNGSYAYTLKEVK